MNSKIINIPPQVQRKGVLCWATCIEMITDTYPQKQPSTVSQKEVCIERNDEELQTLQNKLQMNPEMDSEETNRRVYHLKDSNAHINSFFCEKENSNNGKYFSLFNHERDSYLRIFKKFGILSQEINGFILFDDIINQLENNQPIIISGVVLPSISFHAILVIGYCNNNINYPIIAINDPYIFYNLPTSTFNGCNQALGGRACFIYDNIYNYNFNKKCNLKNNPKSISNISNFSNNSTLPPLSCKPTDNMQPITFTNVQDAIGIFDIGFLNETFNFIPNLLLLNPIVTAHSIFFFSNGDNYTTDGIMLMPININTNKEHLLEFIYDLETALNGLITPICIRQPYYNGYLKVSGVALSNGKYFSFYHEEPNYSLINVPDYGYNFINFKDGDNEYVTPIETYKNINMSVENAYSIDIFKKIIDTLNSQK